VRVTFLFGNEPLRFGTVFECFDCSEDQGEHPRGDFTGLHMDLVSFELRRLKQVDVDIKLILVDPAIGFNDVAKGSKLGVEVRGFSLHDFLEELIHQFRKEWCVLVLSKVIKRKRLF
jgi:hypothetical protein